MRIKKIPRSLLLGSLTIGASLIDGLLSFSGMLALWPILPVALASVALLELYEGEIYFKNLKGALKKLSTKHYNENYLARKYLEEKLPKDLNIESDENIPPYLKEYLTLLQRIEEMKANASKGKKSKEEKKALKLDRKLLTKEKKGIESLVAKLLFSYDLNQLNETEKKHQVLLKTWLNENDGKSWESKFKKNRWILRVMISLAAIGSVLMGVGTLFLLLEAATTIPFFMTFTLPATIAVSASLSVISAIAYGLLTYNLLTDFINDETFGRWLETIRNITKEGWSARSIFKGLTAISLIGLTIAMTICTAGTWWTISKNARAISAKLNLPFVVMEIFHPIMVGIFSLVTSLQNATQSLVLLGLFSKQESRPSPSFFQRTKTAIQQTWNRENWLQFINPFRFLILCTFTPIRILLFIGHLISTSVTNDRMPGVPESASIGMSILFEGLGDLSYFFSSSEENASEEERDIPTLFLTTLFLPLTVLAKGWDWMTKAKQPQIIEQRLDKSENFSVSNNSNGLLIEKGAASSKFFLSIPDDAQKNVIGTLQASHRHCSLKEVKEQSIPLNDETSHETRKCPSFANSNSSLSKISFFSLSDDVNHSNASLYKDNQMAISH